MKTLLALKDSEVWYQDREDRDYWHGEHGLIVNTAALNERDFYYAIVRIHTCADNHKKQGNHAYA